LVWRENLDKVFAGLNLNMPATMNYTILQLVMGASLTSYHNGIKESLDTLWEANRKAAATGARGAVAVQVA